MVNENGEISLRTGSNMSIEQLHEEVKRVRDTKKDFIVHGENVFFKADNENTNVHFDLPDEKNLGITGTAHGQISAKTKIPKRYYDHMAEQGQYKLLAENVNTWLHQKGKNYLIRVLDNNVRALLSPRYRIMDNYDLLFASLGEFEKVGARVESCDLTDTHMYIRATLPNMQEEIRKDDIVVPGIVIQNSEVGNGSLKVEPMVIRLICNNGLIGTTPIKRIHLGKLNDLEGILSDKTIQLGNAEIWEKTKDYIRATFKPEIFAGWVAKLRESTEVPVMDPSLAVKNIVATYALPETAKEELLSHFVKEKDPTQYGLTQSLTRYARDLENPEERIRLQRAGGELISYEKKQFEKLITREVPKPIKTRV